MTSITRIVTQSRTEAVVNALAEFVAVEGLSVNDRFPAERTLAEALGVSRPVLREALRHLATLRIIESKTGSGTYLRRPFSTNDRHVVMHIEMERDSLLQLLELRRALETEAAALAAQRIKAAELRELAVLVDKLESEFAQSGENTESDKAFHLALYRFTGNPLFMQLLEQVWEGIQQFWQYPLGKRDFAQRSMPLHRKIYERVKAHDADGARAAVNEMLDIVQEDLNA